MVNLSVCADESGVSPPPASFLMVFIISSFASALMTNRFLVTGSDLVDTGFSSSA